LRTLLTPSEFRTGFHTNPFTAVASQFLGSRCERVNDIGKVKKFFLFVSFMCRFSHIYNVSVVLTCVFVISYIYNVPIFLLFMDSFCSFFVHVRLRSFRSMTSFFCSCPAPVFRIYDPPLYILTIPVLFHIILCCFRSNFGSSVLCPVYMYCVLYLAFLHVAIFFLFAVLPGFCLSVLAMYFVLSSTLQTPPFLLNWYQKTKFTSLRQYHFICTVL
jgi:hypothetical protein